MCVLGLLGGGGGGGCFCFVYFFRWSSYIVCLHMFVSVYIYQCISTYMCDILTVVLTSCMYVQTYNNFIEKTKAELKKESDSAPDIKSQIRDSISVAEKSSIKPPLHRYQHISVCVCICDFFFRNGIGAVYKNPSFLGLKPAKSLTLRGHKQMLQ